MPTRRLLTQPWSMLAAASVILLIAAGSFLATPLWWDGQSPVKAQDNQGAISNLVLSSPNPGQIGYCLERTLRSSNGLPGTVGALRPGLSLLLGTQHIRKGQRVPHQHIAHGEQPGRRGLLQGPGPGPVQRGRTRRQPLERPLEQPGNHNHLQSATSAANTHAGTGAGTGIRRGDQSGPIERRRWGIGHNVDPANRSADRLPDLLDTRR